MLINNLLKKPNESLIYCERYVNDGSPSEFSEKNNTSFETNPFESNPSFNIPSLIDNETNFEHYGNKNLIPAEYLKFYIHPDMVNHEQIKNYKKDFSNLQKAFPTSSSRTLLLDLKQPIYAKLHFDGLIGRINRRLIFKKAIAGVEVSREIKAAMDSDIIESKFLGILEEPISIIHKNPLLNNDCSWGIVFRNYKPTFNSKVNCAFQLPYFSLFSSDRKRNDSKILLQLIKLWGNSAYDIIAENILVPIIDIYFELIVKLGFQNEMNAQNILLSFDESFIPNGIILRDFMGFEKDIEIRIINDLNTNFDSAPYKVISSKDENYQIRHSFAFDFKVCQYVIKPIIDEVELINPNIKTKMLDRLKSKTLSWLTRLPHDYFPEGGWYSHDKVLLDNKREYILNNNPFLR